MQDEIAVARRRKRRKIKWKRFLKFIAALVVLTVAILIAANTNATTLSDTKDFFKTVFAWSGAYPAELGSSAPSEVEQMSMAYAVVTENEFMVMAQGGKRLMTEKHGFVSPYVTAAGNRAVLFNRASRDLRVYNRTALLAEVRTEYAIVDVAVSDNGNLAVLTESDLYMCELAIYTNGKYEWKMTWKGAQGFPYAVAISPDGSRAAAATVDLKNGEIVTYITVIDIAKETERYVCEVPGLCVQLWCDSDGAATAVTDSSAVAVSSGGEIRYSYDFDGRQLISVARDEGSKLALGFGDNSRATVNEAVILGRNLAESAVIENCGKIKDMYLASNRLYILGDARVTAYNVNGTVNKILEADPDAVKLVEFASIIEILPDRADRLTTEMEEGTE